jgi:hypothetical protein
MSNQTGQGDTLDSVRRIVGAADAPLPRLLLTDEMRVSRPDAAPSAPDISHLERSIAALEARVAGIALARPRPAVVTDLRQDDELRAIVSDMVRDELRGALGEQITRRVRQMIRSEINRALAADPPGPGRG